MRNFKHIITYQCKMNCEYCINKQLKKEFRGDDCTGIHFQSMEDAYYSLSKGTIITSKYDNVIISGGEPTLEWGNLLHVIDRANVYFKKVSVITANPDRLNFLQDAGADDVLYSIHDPNAPIPYVTMDIPVYASLVASNYRPWMPPKLLYNNFRGMSISEEFPYGERIRDLIPTYANFSVRLSFKEECLNGHILLPNNVFIDAREAFHA